MLSQDIRNAAAALRQLVDGGRLSPAMALILADHVDDLALRTECLEAGVVPAGQRLAAAGELPANVVRLAALLHRRGVSLGLPPAGSGAPEGGAA